MKRLDEAGIRVPDDVAITGFNNSIFARTSKPTLTTVDNKAEMMGQLSFQLLHGLITGENVSSNLLIRPDLVIGEST